MKKAEVVEGQTYIARVSGRRCRVRIDKAMVKEVFKGNGVGRPLQRRSTQYWEATNLETGRQIIIKSAMRLENSPELVEHLKKVAEKVADTVK